MRRICSWSISAARCILNCVFGACLPFLFLIASADARTPVPRQAKDVGYGVLTFESTLNRNEVDVKQTAQSGYHWYLWNFFGKRASSSELQFGTDGVLTLSGGHTGPNGEIATGASVPTKSGFVGIAFGGGAYIEASLKFDPKSVQRANYAGHPSFWSIPAERLAEQGNRGNQPGIDKFVRSIEIDFFEYNLARISQAQDIYGGAIHYWFGIPNRTCPQGLCRITTANDEKWMPPDTNFARFHTYGFLWVPATPIRRGYAQFYFDNAPIGKRTEWKQYTGPVDPVKGRRAGFSLIDHEHFILVLGTGVGEPMSIGSVRVYQSSAAANLRH